MFRKLVFLLLFAFFISASLILFFFIFFIFFYSQSTENEHDSSSDLYHYQSIGHFSNTTSSGFTTINRKLQKTEFLSNYNAQTDSTIIISNFASSQYRCSGSCICTDSFRRSSVVLTRSLFVIFSAISSTVAIKIAEKSFQDRCVHQFSHSCDENISSEVSSCSEQEEPEEEEFAEYACEGFCSPKKFNVLSSQVAQQNFEKERKCVDLKQNKVIVIKRTINYDRVKEEKGIHLPDRFKHLTRDARAMFSKTHLTPFCKEMSTISLWYIGPRGQRRLRDRKMCIGPLGNVKCALVSESYLKARKFMDLRD